MTATTTSERAPRPGRTSPPSVSGFRTWLAKSASGAVFEYHRGLLSADRAPGSDLGARRQRIVAELGDAAIRAADHGLVHLVQRRNGPFDFSYLAIKASIAAQPAQAMARSEQFRHGGFEHAAILPVAA